MKYQKISDCPPSLKAWLDLINSVPFGRENYLPSWEILLSNAYFELTGQDIRSVAPLPPELDTGEREAPTHEQQQAYIKSYDVATESLKRKTERFPQLYSYLFETGDNSVPQNIYDEIRSAARASQYEKSAFLRYEEFQEMRFDIRRIVRSCMEYQSSKRFIDNEEIFQKLGFKGRRKTYPVNFKINEKGRIAFESNLINILSDVDAHRLRICPICDEIFWVKRIEANSIINNGRSCSKKRCSNNFHQRSLRIKELENKAAKEFEILEKHRANLSPENNLIAQQPKKVNTLLEKINREKIKNGAL
jgi:hypothetical protein